MQVNKGATLLNVNGLDKSVVIPAFYHQIVIASVLVRVQKY